MWLFSSRCASNTRLEGKTAIVTGCNTGIGKETVLEFVKRGARVIMACRDLQKAEAAAEDIRKKTKGMTGIGEVVVAKLDLASLASVRECAQHLLRTEPRINLLINNAGVMACPKSNTQDGFEMQFGVNHLGHFLLTSLLMPRILRSTPARIVNVSSHMHWFGNVDFEDLNWEKSYSPSLAYARSKLANVMFTYELAERLKGVTTYAVHPGIVHTELGRHLESSSAVSIFKGILEYFFKTPKQGAQTTIYCASDENVGKESGLYYRCYKTTNMRANADVQRGGSQVTKKLWEVSSKLVGLEDWDPFTAPDHPTTILMCAFVGADLRNLWVNSALASSYGNPLSYKQQKFVSNFTAQLPFWRDRAHYYMFCLMEHE
ncbi:hypothetical protein L9F63_020043, partial [Diploptera punctata]